MDENHPENIKESLEQPEAKARHFADLSLMEVVGMLVAHPLATLGALQEILQQESAYHTVAAGSGPGASTGSLPMVSIRPAEEIDWQRYLPTIYLGGLILLGLVG